MTQCKYGVHVCSSRILLPDLLMLVADADEPARTEALVRASGVPDPVRAARSRLAGRHRVRVRVRAWPRLPMRPLRRRPRSPTRVHARRTRLQHRRWGAHVPSRARTPRSLDLRLLLVIPLRMLLH